MKKTMRGLICLLAVILALISGLTASAEADLAINPDLDPAWQNILLLGTDNRSSDEVGRTDTMIILSVNAEEKSVRLTSLMRDMWVDIYGTSRTHKINAANVFGGTDAAMATVNYYFGMNIEDYVLVDMDGLTQIINKIGGVEIALSEEEAKVVNQSMKEQQLEEQATVSGGESVHLTGEQAMAYVRIRSIGGDQQRTERQRTVLLAMAAKLKETSVWSLMDVAMTMMGYVQTNLSMGEILDLGMTALEVDLAGVEQMRIPQDGAYTMGREEKSGLSVVWADFEKNTELLHEFIYGE